MMKIRCSDIDTSDINRPGLQFAGFLIISPVIGYRSWGK